LAKQTIDILGILREKTRGNLTPDEEKMMDHLLTDLRWRYVREAKNRKRQNSGISIQDPEHKNPRLLNLDFRILAGGLLIPFRSVLAKR
jgi:hypothetical protein